MIIVNATYLSSEQKQAIMALWNGEYPKQLVFADNPDLDTYLSTLHNPQHLFYIHEQKIMGWAFSFEREYERWFAIIINSDQQYKGVGSTLLTKLKETNPVLNGWVIDHDNDVKQDGTVYKSPLAFYTKHGFNTVNKTRLETDKLSAVKIMWTKINAYL